MSTTHERWRTLVQLDEWLRGPMLLLSLLWLLIVVSELTFGESGLLTAFATIIWIIFILEFALRFTLAPGKRLFLKKNWLTVVALLVPALRLFRALSVLRAASALRSFRLVRIVGAANRSMNALRAALRRRQFGYVVALTLLVLGLGSAGMLSFEPAAEVDGGFTSYGDALWWTGMLVASIGTEYWPVTTEGRVLAALLALYGLAVFGYITATFASFFIGRDAEAPTGPIAGSREIDTLREELRALRLSLDRQAAG